MPEVYFVIYRSKYTSLLPRSICLEYLLLWDTLYLSVEVGSWLQQEDGICVTATPLACDFPWAIENQWWSSPNIFLCLLFWWCWCMCFPTFTFIALRLFIPSIIHGCTESPEVEVFLQPLSEGICTSMLPVKHLIFPLRVLKVLLGYTSQGLHLWSLRVCCTSV